MDYFGINSADDLPKIKEVLSEHLVEPTLIKNGLKVNDSEDAAEALAVTDEGELIVNKELGEGEES